MKILGLDEAGRGAVLGPMVIGAFLIEAGQVPALVKTGATDSKKLSAARREGLIGPMTALGDARVWLLSPAEIDAGNLNDLEELVFARLIAEARPDRVIIDAPCNPRGIPAFKARLLGRLGFEVELVVEPKADLNHPPCGAASIFAKVERDRQVSTLGPLGSGYPSDPVTRRWLKGLLARDEALPECVRTRWGTLDELRAELSQQDLFA